MIKTKYGNLLDAKGVIVHGCNCQGVMGSGVALQIKQKWPEVFRVYRSAYEENISGGLYLGKTQTVKVTDDTVVVNAMTQYRYGRDGKKYVDYAAIVAAFNAVNTLASKLKMPVNFPLIGCGLAGGDWNVVSSIIDEELDDSLEKVLWLPVMSMYSQPNS